MLCISITHGAVAEPEQPVVVVVAGRRGVVVAVHRAAARLGRGREPPADPVIHDAERERHELHAAAAVEAVERRRVAAREPHAAAAAAAVRERRAVGRELLDVPRRVDVACVERESVEREATYL